tara:strand:+ start:154 stop:408 length:255 start_codon:yes stop_codon:yes gene_type:complete
VEKAQAKAPSLLRLHKPEQQTGDLLVFVIGISSFILPGKFYFRIPSRSGELPHHRCALDQFMPYRDLGRRAAIRRRRKDQGGLV